MKRYLILSLHLILALWLVNPAAAQERPTYVVAFVPLNWSGSRDQFEAEARRQGELFLVESGINNYADIQFRFVANHLDGLSLSSRWLVQEVVAFGLLQEPADRYVGLTDGDLAPDGDSGVAGWTFGPDSLGLVVEASDSMITAHELGHTFDLCDEYSFPAWEGEDAEWGCPNPYPPGCLKSDSIGCNGNPAPDRRNSIMGPAGLRGGYAYNAPSLAHLQERFAAMFGPASPPPDPNPPEPPAPVAQDIVFAAPELRRMGQQGVSVELAPGPVFQPDWSAGGEWIAFSAPYQGNLDLYRVAAGGGPVEQLTDSPARDSHPAWLPHGRQLIFVSDRQGSPALYLLDIGSGQVKALTMLPAPAGWPAVSPAGDRLAFSAAPDGDWELFVVYLDGDGLPLEGTLAPITRSLGLDISPAWRPDGAAVAFASTRQGTLDLYSYDLGWQELSLIRSTPANEWAPKWLLDGRVVYQKYDGQRLGLQVVNLVTGQASALDTNLEAAAWPAPQPPIR